MSSRHGGAGSSSQAAGPSSQAAGPSTQAAGGSASQGPSDIVRSRFLQMMMANKYMPEASAKDLLNRIWAPCSDSQYNGVLAQINDDVLDHDFQLKILKNPMDGVRYLGLINRDVDGASKLGTHLTVPQREFFKAVVEHVARSEMMVNGVGMVGGIELLNLDVSVARSAQDTQADEAGPSTQAGPSSTQAPAATVLASKLLSKKDRQTTLTELVSQGWLASAPQNNNQYCLGVRTLLELDMFLRNLEGLPSPTKAMLEAIS